MKVAVSGSSGTIGTALVAGLRARGHEVVRLVRREPAGPGEVRWSPERGGAPDDALVADLQGVDAAINLAGAGVAAKRWTDSYQHEILRSRVDSTTALVAALTRLDPAPRVLLSGSADGFYGDTGDTVTDESGPQGTTFLSGVAAAWEQAAAPAADAGIRLVLLRTSMVVAPSGGAFGAMRPLFRLGVGGRIGPGTQWWSVISLRDHVAATLHLLGDDTAAGPYNLALPEPVTNAQVTAALAAHLHRPALVPAPAFAVRAVLGGFAQEILESRRVVPARLEQAGFTFTDATLEAALATLD